MPSRTIGSFSLVRVGDPAFDGGHHLGRSAPGHLRRDRRRIQHDDSIEARVRIGLERAPVSDGAIPRLALRRERPAFQVGDRGLVDRDHAGARAGLDRHVAHGHPAFHRQGADRGAAELDRVAGAAGRADLADDRERNVLGGATERQHAIHADEHRFRFARAAGTAWPARARLPRCRCRKRGSRRRRACSCASRRKPRSCRAGSRRSRGR